MWFLLGYRTSRRIVTGNVRSTRLGIQNYADAADDRIPICLVFRLGI